eukprot:COSAG06_NODE_3170_length_5738_cov_8.008689_2_plen_469_part_00
MRTKTLSVIAMFYTPAADAVSLLNIEFDMSLASVQGTASINHYPSIPEDQVWQWRAFNICGIAVCISLLVLMILADKSNGVLFRRNNPFSHFWDEVLCVLLAVYMVIQGAYLPSARSNIEDTFGTLLNLKWDNQNSDYTQKVETYFEHVENALSMINYLDGLESVGFVLGMISLGRIVMYFAVHPRIQILPGVIVHAAHELFSFSQYAALVYVALAVLASFIFGRNNEAYSTVSGACHTQYEAVIGEFDGFLSVGQTSPNKPLAVAVYMVTFTAFVLFMLINLLLAIIVESYMDTKKALQTISKECSQSLIEHLIAVAQLTVNRYIFGWPAHSDLTMALEDLTPDAEGYVHEADFNKSEKLRVTDSAGDKPQACQFENPLGMFTRDNEGPTEDSDEPNAIFDFYHSFQFLRSKLDDSKEQDTAARFRKRATHSSSNLMSTNDEGEGLDDEGLDDDDDNDNPLNLPDTM